MQLKFLNLFRSLMNNVYKRIEVHSIIYNALINQYYEHLMQLFNKQLVNKWFMKHFTVCKMQNSETGALSGFLYSSI